MIKYFGQRWDAPLLDNAEQVSIPVGQKCLDCQETIESDDRGLMMPVVVDSDSGEYQSTKIPGVMVVPVHLECYLASMLAHNFKQCHHYVNHPSVRAEARATLAAMNEQRHACGMGDL